jgi:hypothetical protein
MKGVVLPVSGKYMNLAKHAARFGERGAFLLLVVMSFRN